MQRIALSILFAVLYLWGAIPLSGQDRITTWFLDAPDSITPHFNREDRKHLIDQYTFSVGGQTVETVRNIYGGNSVLLSLSDTRITVKIDDSTLFEMKALSVPGAGKELIGVIYTDRTAPAISSFVFYDPAKSWQRLPARTFVDLPRAEDFLTDQALIEDPEVKKALVERGLWTYSVSFTDNEETLIFTPTTFTEKTALALYPDMASKLVKGLVYEWNKKAFKPRQKLLQ